MTPTIRDYLRAAGGDAAGPADADLLARFAAGRDEAAFELLVWRHAGLVQRVCRSVLRDHHAAEDAAQAAFLVLARKAHTFAGRGPVVGWLYRVARRVAIRLAKQRSRRPASSAELDRVPAPAGDGPAADGAAVWAEVYRLPERYRVPVLLCFFEGLTQAEAARRTGWPIGTVAGRLARAKDLLARRLTPKGVGVAGVVLGVPAGSFVGGTARAAAAFAARLPVVPGVTPSVARLAEGALTMTAVPLKLAAVLIACAATAGVWGLTPAGTKPAPQPAARPAGPADGERVADAAQRDRSKSNLKHLMLAIQNYESAYGHLPRNITDKAGKPLLSWRVALLPYLEQEELYKAFKFDEPWDSDHNKKLVAKMPDWYRVGFEPKDSTATYYQVFAGKGSAFEPGAKVLIRMVTDRTSNTIGVAEAGPPVEWTRPSDLPFDQDEPFVRPALPFKNTFNVGMLDGSALTLDPRVAADTLKNLVGRADGMVTPELETLAAKFELTKEDVKAAREALAASQKLVAAVAAQLNEQQKLLAELAKHAGAPVSGPDLERLNALEADLALALNDLKEANETLRKQVEALGKK